MADGGGFPACRPLLPDPLLQRRRGRSNRRLVSMAGCALAHPLVNSHWLLTLCTVLISTLASQDCETKKFLMAWRRAGCFTRSWPSGRAEVSPAIRMTVTN